MADMIDWNELSQRGLIVRINNEILHPIGLALARTTDGVSPGALVADDGVFYYKEQDAKVKWVEALDDVLGCADGDKEITDDMIEKLYEIRSFLVHNQKEDV